MVDLIVIAAGVVALIFINGAYVAAEFALVATRPSQVRQLAVAGRTGARHLWQLISNLEALNRSLATTQLGITAASLGLGMWAEAALAGRIAPWLESWRRWSASQAEGVAFALTLAVLTYLHVVLGEMLPKSIALSYPEATGLALAPFVSLSQRLSQSLVLTVNSISNALVRLLRVQPVAEHERALDMEELALLIQESAQGGVIADREREILLGVLGFRQRAVRDLMTPRARIVGFPLDVSPTVLAAAAIASNHTRFPIYEGDLDHVVGILHLADYLRWEQETWRPPDLRRLVRPVGLVAPALSAQGLLELFRRQRRHMAIVVDESGRTVGLVTLDDVAQALAAASP